MLAAVWLRNRQLVLQRLDSIDSCLAALKQGDAPEQLRSDARNDAHKLAGSLGMFGLQEGTLLARRIEHALEAGAAIDESERVGLSKAAERLRQLIENHRLNPEPAASPNGHRLLILESSAEVSDSLIAEARRRGMQAHAVSDLVSACSALDESDYELLIMDLGAADLTGGSGDDRAERVRDVIMSHAPMQVVALTSNDTFEDRVTAAQVGAHGFLPKSVSPAEILDNCEHLLDLQNAHFKIVAVDDDAATLNALKSLLEQHSMRVTGVSDPRLFWEALQDTSPDLIILDMQMPDFSGVELCRAVRSDNAWKRVPILFLSADVDGDTVTEIYRAGADDFVAKPIIEIELLTRVRNRLERDRLYRSFSDFDPLTGVRNRRSSNIAIANYLRLAERHRLPLSLVVLDLDKFKRVNDTYGHQAGDDVLQYMGGLLKQSFRSEDVVARWGGEEFVVAMFAMRRADAVERVAHVLARMEEHRFQAPDGTPFHVAFSAGLAEFPDDGADLHSLYRVADESLYRAKSAGRGRIFSVRSGHPDAGTDFAIVTANNGAAAGLRRSLEIRGYNVNVMESASEAVSELAGDAHRTATRIVIFDEMPPAEAQRVVAALPTSTHCVALSAPGDAWPAGIEHIDKPYKHSALMLRLRRMLEK